MARIAGIDLPKDKRIEIGLTYIYGIGRKSAKDILEKAARRSHRNAKNANTCCLWRRMTVVWRIRSNAARRSPTVNFAGHSRPTAGKSNRTRRDNVWQNPT